MGADLRFEFLVYILHKMISLSINFCGVSMPSKNEVFSIISKSKESANHVRKIPQMTQNLNTIMVR